MGENTSSFCPIFFFFGTFKGEQLNTSFGDDDDFSVEHTPRQGRGRGREKEEG